MHRFELSLEGRALQAYVLAPGEFVVGRDPAAAVVIANLAISRQHAKLVLTEGSCEVVDLSSDNGVVVDGQRVARSPLRPGQAIGLGKFTLHYAGTVEVTSEADHQRLISPQMRRNHERHIEAARLDSDQKTVMVRLPRKPK